MIWLSVCGAVDGTLCTCSVWANERADAVVGAYRIIDDVEYDCCDCNGENAAAAAAATTSQLISSTAEVKFLGETFLSTGDTNSVNARRFSSAPFLSPITFTQCSCSCVCVCVFRLHCTILYSLVISFALVYVFP